MKIGDFRILNLSQQASTVFALGVLLGSRERDQFNISLYQIEDFYIEVYIHQYNGQIVGFSSFINTDELDPYLAKIDISPLLQTS